MTFLFNLSVTKLAILGLVALAVTMWIALFLPALSLSYWQGWIYCIVFFTSVTAICLYFIKKDITLIARRIKAGPTAEKQRRQKVKQAFASIFFVLLLLTPSLDYHFHWSVVPAYLVVASDVFVVLRLAVVFLVFKENTYTSAIVEINREQKVISTGLYVLVCHPMYSGALLMLFFTPLALGSFWGLLSFFPMLVVIGFRLIEEEKFLIKRLPRYSEYCKKNRNHLIPFI